MIDSALTTRICKFLKDDDGPTSVEYAVLVALILSVCIVSVRALGDNTTGMWGKTITKLDEAGFMD